METEQNQIIETVLPAFRVAGLDCKTCPNDVEKDWAQLWQQWFSGSLKTRMPAFSQTVYCVFICEDGKICRLLLGNLLSADAPLPEGAAECWLPPQHYRVSPLTACSAEAALAGWQASASVNRQRQYDFASYPPSGMGKLYQSIQGEAVAISCE